MLAVSIISVAVLLACASSTKIVDEDYLFPALDTKIIDTINVIMQLTPSYT